jgi:hypothetical protein
MEDGGNGGMAAMKIKSPLFLLAVIAALFTPAEAVWVHQRFYIEPSVPNTGVLSGLDLTYDSSFSQIAIGQFTAFPNTALGASTLPAGILHLSIFAAGSPLNGSVIQDGVITGMIHNFSFNPATGIIGAGAWINNPAGLEFNYTFRDEFEITTTGPGQGFAIGTVRAVPLGVPDAGSSAALLLGSLAAMGAFIRHGRRR